MLGGRKPIRATPGARRSRYTDAMQPDVQPRARKRGEHVSPHAHVPRESNAASSVAWPAPTKLTLPKPTARRRSRRLLLRPAPLWETAQSRGNGVHTVASRRARRLAQGARRAARTTRSATSWHGGRDLVVSPEYRESEKARLLAGTAPHLETYLLNRIFGKPKETVSHEGPAQSPFMVVLCGPPRDPLAPPDAPTEVVDAEVSQKALPAAPPPMRGRKR